eukprot:NODE_4698_length_559_cov_572.790196_g3426_i0.p1 GENE.NODE_4698_length_559_cov_572.790196_g3426_i0~~NODE_4698_length_559_cov_572.790196_g3426_i0.p1  ORF type:complete len:129 (+),score=11.95 NODE_4698_length_559_cov_572.790196_g3426_i0:62-448(+)
MSLTLSVGQMLSLLPLAVGMRRFSQRLASQDSASAVDTNAYSLKTRAKMAKKGPYAIDVKAGETYSWCTCGYSSKQPFCDGAHKKVNEEHGTAFKSLKYQATKDETLYFCGCKQTNKAPFCDGTHSSL